MEHIAKIITSKAFQYLVFTFCALLLIEKLKESYKDLNDYRNNF